jgi:hydroxyacyl-ACP dehydratase HTD2-like protein with hotdog domain
VPVEHDAKQLHFDDVEIGQPIPTLTVRATTTQLFFFSAATYNGHRIHYDRNWAVDVEGYPDVLVHGPLQAALMARAVTDWIGADGRLVRFQVQNRSSAFPGEELRFTGTVTGIREIDGRGLVDLDISGEKGDGVVLMPGSATVELPRRADRER